MRSARLALALLLTTSLGCAQKDWSDRTLVTEDATRIWTGATVSQQSNFDVRLELWQEGPNITGTFHSGVRIANWIVLTGPIEGRVSG